MSGKNTRSRAALAISAGTIAVLLTVRQPLPAVDFVRGDANSDGRVTVADSLFLLGDLFWGTQLSCEAAGDFDNDERVEFVDAVRILVFVTLGGDPPAAPFPDPGPDTTTDPDGHQTSCDSYGGVSPVEDPAARLEVLPALATGGEDVHAVISVAASNSVRLGSLSGTIRVDADIFEDVLYDNRDPVGIQFLTDLTTGFRRGRVEENRIHFAMISNFHEPEWIEPGEEAPVMAFTVCLKPGTPAGEYPLVLETAEFGRGIEYLRDEQGNAEINEDAGLSIEPELVSGTLTVLADVEERRTCDVRPLGELNAAFRLIGATAPPGGSIGIPFVIHADRECQGFGFNIAFDPDVLQATSIGQLYPEGAVSDERWERLEIDNSAGNLWGEVIFGFDEEDFTFPAFQDNAVLVFRFSINPETTEQVTEVRFEGTDRGQGAYNFFKAFGDTFTPELANSFVFTDASVQVVPDISLFIRGDANGDRKVDISDPQRTLSFLFLGGLQPYCLDAADANDDGRLDVSDPIATLGSLFLGTGPLPPPNDTPAEDPTPDSFGCLYDYSPE